MNMETEAAGAEARAGQLAKDQGNGLGLHQLGGGTQALGPRSQLTPLPTPAGGSQTWEDGRGAETQSRRRGKEREGKKANLSPNLCLTSHSMLAWSPDSPTSRLRSREDGEGGGRRGGWAEPGEPEDAGGASQRASPPARPSLLLISPSISHTYIYFFSNSPPSPTTNHHNRSAAHAYCMQGVGLYFQTFCKETTRIFRTTHNHSPPPPPRNHIYILCYIISLDLPEGGGRRNEFLASCSLPPSARVLLF